MSMEKIHVLKDRPFTYCPGCDHGILAKLIAKAIQELGIWDRAVMVGSVGCSTLVYYTLDVDYLQAPHGRAPAVMTAIKRLRPDLVTFSIQGDGDALAIGLSELVYAAQRGEPITVFLYNNMIYGMTGGQMAPTTLPGMPTTTSPYGRDVKTAGPPMDACKLLSSLPGPSYIRRVVIAPRPIETPKGIMYSVKNVLEAYEAIKQAFKVQIMGGFSFVEFLGSCYINWKMNLYEAKKVVWEKSAVRYKPGIYVDEFKVSDNGG